MSYNLSKTINGIDFNNAVKKVKEELKKEGFGIVSEIDISATLKSKIDVDFKKYLILGACNPHYAYKALQSEDKIGLFLPCNIVVADQGEGKIEISAIDPIVAMASVENKDLDDFAKEVKKSMLSVIKNL